MSDKLLNVLTELRYSTSFVDITEVEEKLDNAIDITKENNLTLNELNNDLGEVFDENVRLKSINESAIDLLTSLEQEGTSELYKEIQEFLYNQKVYSK